MNIIFGSKKLGQIDGQDSNEKYPNRPVVTLEGDRGKGKTRRIIFNRTAMELMNLETGFVQQIVFGTIDSDENGNRGILVANANDLLNVDDLTTYNTSKNQVKNENGEKGKAISSARLTREIITFLDLDEDSEQEYELKAFDAQEIDSFRMIPIVSEQEEEVTEEAWDHDEVPEYTEVSPVAE